MQRFSGKSMSKNWLLILEALLWSSSRQHLCILGIYCNSKLSAIQFLCLSQGKFICTAKPELTLNVFFPSLLTFWIFFQLICFLFQIAQTAFKVTTITLQCAVKLEQTHGNANRVFKVSEEFKEWLHQFQPQWLSVAEEAIKPPWVLIFHSIIHYTMLGFTNITTKNKLSYKLCF